jgi:hypothetical protein
MKSRAVIALLGLLFPAAAGAQQEFKPVDLPDGPARPGFDISRFNNTANGRFETFYVVKTEPLAEVLEEGRVAEDTRLLVTETAAGNLALIMDQMAFHHVAQGRAGDKDWLATF